VNSGHEDHSCLRYDTLLIGNSLETFQKDLPASICRVLLLLLLLLILLLTAIDLSLGGSSP